MQAKEHQAKTDAGDERPHVGDSRDVPRPQRGRQRFLAQRSQLLPFASKIARQKEHQQQADAFNRLHWSKIHLRVTRARTGSEHDEQRGQRERAQKREKRQLPEPCSAEIDGQRRAERRQANDGTLRKRDEHQRVANGIAHADHDGESQTGEQMSDAEQHAVHLAKHPPREEARCVKRQHEVGEPPEQLRSEIAEASHDDAQFELRELSGTEQGDIAARAGASGQTAESLRVVRGDAQACEIANVIEIARARAHHKASDPFRGEPPVPFVIDDTRQCREQIVGALDRIEIHDTTDVPSASRTLNLRAVHQAGRDDGAE